MRKRGRKREEEEAGKKKDKEDGEAVIGTLSALEKEVNTQRRGSNITKWTSGVDLLAFFYKLLVSLYTVKAF